MLYLVRLASVLGVDLDEAVRQKLVINAAKYPVDRAHAPVRNIRAFRDTPRLATSYLRQKDDLKKKGRWAVLGSNQ